MSGFVLSPRAQADLDDIWIYTAATWDDHQAERYIRDIWHAIRMLAADPRKARASDVVRAGLRLLEEREVKLAALRAALAQGEASGPSTPFDFEAFIARRRDEAKSDASTA